jgi:hypothetical protein
MTRKINLDERLAAKGEVTKEPVVITFRGSDWKFSPSMPAALPEVAAEGKIMSALLMVLDPAQKEDFNNLNVTIDEVGVLFEVLAEVYGTTPGESSASD